MGTRKLASAILALLLAAAGTVANAQDTREITGRITQVGGAPLADANVSVLGQALGVRSNANGEYRIRVPQGEVSLLVRAIGFKRESARVPVPASTVNADTIGD